MQYHSTLVVFRQPHILHVHLHGDHTDQLLGRLPHEQLELSEIVSDRRIGYTDIKSSLIQAEANHQQWRMREPSCKTARTGVRVPWQKL